MFVNYQDVMNSFPPPGYEIKEAQLVINFIINAIIDVIIIKKL